ncbi:MAG: flagellar assembly protein FliH, partial [Bacteroidota bacterium]|nr:flagellar assembly protein FliH [Bacteroidota bacterium]
DKNQPLDISLSNVYELSLPIEEMRKEIQSAYDKGFKDGCDTTQATMTVELMKQQEWLRNFDLITQDLREQFSKVLSDLEDSVSTLSIIAAQHILSHEVTANSQIVVEQTKKAIATLDNDEIFKIRLHPDDVEILKEAKSRLVSDRTRMDKVVLASDESVEPGGCILETSAGIVDARLTTQLETIKQSLLTVAKQPSAKEEAINEISNMQNPAEE